MKEYLKEDDAISRPLLIAANSDNVADSAAKISSNITDSIYYQQRTTKNSSGILKMMLRHNRQCLYFILIIISLIIIYRWVNHRDEKVVGDRVVLKHDHQEFGMVASDVSSSHVALTIYMESKCPDTTRFIKTQLWPTWQSLGKTKRIDIQVIPFGKARCKPTDAANSDYTCECQHGDSECVLNSLMSCVMEHLRYDVDAYLPHIVCIQGKGSLDEARRDCLVSRPLLPEQLMTDCASSPHGRRLLALAGDKTSALQPPLSFVPWVMLNGERVIDALYALRENLCTRLTMPVPIECLSAVGADQPK